jgi:hypothetical protein
LKGRRPVYRTGRGRSNTSVPFVGPRTPITIVAMVKWVLSHWRVTAIVACALGVAATFRLNRDEAPTHRDERHDKDVQKLAERISKFARDTHQAYPTGDVIVSEDDLAMRLRKPPDRIANALEKLLKDGKVERAPLSGYWKLNPSENSAN